MDLTIVLKGARVALFPFPPFDLAVRVRAPDSPLGMTRQKSWLEASTLHLAHCVLITNCGSIGVSHGFKLALGHRSMPAIG